MAWPQVESVARGVEQQACRRRQLGTWAIDPDESMRPSNGLLMFEARPWFVEVRKLARSDKGLYTHVHLRAAMRRRSVGFGSINGIGRCRRWSACCDSPDAQLAERKNDGANSSSTAIDCVRTSWVVRE